MTADLISAAAWRARDDETFRHIATAAEILAAAEPDRERMEGRILRRLLPHITRGNDR